MIERGLNMSKQENLLRTRTDKELLEGWKLISSQPMTEEIPIVRGWYMDEIERRFPKEFNQWLESETCEDDEIIQLINL